ncbi:MAG: hypothetical protein E2591_21300 [Achromobacter sp.]|uniref:hypothetical protein n=1 Tax=Achromobacter TaxID=222 RepID=UPI000F8FADF8|nr:MULTISPECIES: hypothetical protein [Achromobacter]AZS77375.1 hypothetical protein ELS24_02310 [Achromobacter spanius]MPS80614.1 hypothetical protein [Achromobacter sp.]
MHAEFSPTRYIPCRYITEKMMLVLGVYLAGLCITAAFAHYRKWYRIDGKALSAQPIFWISILVPAASFLFFGCFSWQGYEFDWSPNGYAKFIEISKLPLAFLSLSIPFSAIVAAIHRTTQTASQMQQAALQLSMASAKNSLDGFYAHQKDFIEHVATWKFGETKIFNSDDRISSVYVAYPRLLYRKIYPGAKGTAEASYSVEPSFEAAIRLKIASINDGLWNHVERAMKNDQPSIGDEATTIYVVLLQTYEIFDHVGIDNASDNYFFIPHHLGGHQLNIVSEADFKELMRLLLKIATAVIDMISTKPLENVSGIRRFAVSANPFFFSFNNGQRAIPKRANTWRETVNSFPHTPLLAK